MAEVHALIEMLRREADPIQQSKIIEQIGKMRASEAVEALIQHAMLNEYQSGAAIVALGSIGDSRAVDVLILSFRYQNLAWIAKDALVKIGSPAVPLLIAALHHENVDVRFMAIRALGEINEPRALDPLQEVIRQDADDTNRKLARSNLKTLLLAALRQPNAQTRLHAVQGLEGLGDARTVEPLQDTADHDPDPTVRQAAMEVIEALLRGVETDPFESHNFPLFSRETKLLINQLHQRAAMSIDPLDKTVTPAAAAVVVEQLQDSLAQSDAFIRQLAHEALEHAAVDLLRSRYAAARLTAVRSLEWLNDPEGARLLRQVAEFDPDPTVRQAAGNLS
jgi:HEAT repeat protein